MAAIVCDLCGGKLVMGAGGVAVCESCGMEHSADRMREKVKENNSGGVAATNSNQAQLVETYLEMAVSAFESSNNEETETYANKVIELNPRTAMAWFYKGAAAGWQTTGRNNRYPESISSWIKAYNFASGEEKVKLEAMIKLQAVGMGNAILQLHCNSYAGYRSEENKKDVTETLDMLKKQFELLKEKTGLDFYSDEVKTKFAGTINSGAVSASDNADKDFGPENRNRDKNSWNRYTAAQDGCLDLLDTAYILCDDESLCLTICKNYIAIAETVRDSCSYTYGSGGYYVEDYSFTPKAKEIRTSSINEWKKKRDLHDPEKKRENSKKAVKIYQSYAGEELKKLAITQYWESHQDEKEALDKELAGIKDQKEALSEALKNNSDKLESEKITAEINDLRTQMNGLGLFKGKEKKALSAKIDELTSKKHPLDMAWNKAQEEYKAKVAALEKRGVEIQREFKKDRGMAQPSPKKFLSLFADGKACVSTMDLVGYFKEVLPAGITLAGEGENAIVNFSKKSHEFLQNALRLLGETSDEMPYVENPNEIKMYEIPFLVNINETTITVDCSATGTKDLISNFLIYRLSGDKTSDNVARFIQIVISTVIGMSPSLNVIGMDEAIADVAYGCSEEIVIDSKEMKIRISGGSKNSPSVALGPVEK